MEVDHTKEEDRDGVGRFLFAQKAVPLSKPAIIRIKNIKVLQSQAPTPFFWYEFCYSLSVKSKETQDSPAPFTLLRTTVHHCPKTPDLLKSTALKQARVFPSRPALL